MEQSELDEIIKKWDNAGYLYDLKNKRNVALAIHFGYKNFCDIVNCNDTYYPTCDGVFNIDTTQLYAPSVYRLFKDIIKDIDEEEIKNKAIKLFIDLSDALNRVDLRNTMTTYSFIDAEAEFVSEFTKNYKL